MSTFTQAAGGGHATVITSILPGGENVCESWEMIREGLDNLEDPYDRVDVTAYYDPNKTTKDKIYCTRWVHPTSTSTCESSAEHVPNGGLDEPDAVLAQGEGGAVHAGINISDGKKRNIGCVLGIGAASRLPTSSTPDSTTS